jgi:peptide/nickel transport system permease protein
MSTTAAHSSTESSANPEKYHRPSRFRFLRSWSARIGLAMLVVLLLIAILGPYLAPHLPDDIVGAPYGPNSAETPLGTDFLGRDALSRILNGGRSLFLLSVLATLVAYVIGLPAGLVAGYKGGRLDTVIMRCVDFLLAFPPLLFLLLISTGTQASIIALVLSAGFILAPSLARIVRAAVLDVAHRSYVEAAITRGERTGRILRREIMPNILGPVLADAGLRLTYAILLIAGMNFLGLGLQPPQSDWALMITENKVGITLQPWVVLVPCLLIAGITVAINLISDSLARSLGTSVEALNSQAATR